MPSCTNQSQLLRGQKKCSGVGIRSTWRALTLQRPHPRMGRQGFTEDLLSDDFVSSAGALVGACVGS